MTRESIEKAIYDLYGIERTDLYANNYGREPALVSTIRYLYWLILKKHFKIPVDNIAAEFSRTSRGIYKGIAQVEWGINKIPYYHIPYCRIIEAASK